MRSIAMPSPQLKLRKSRPLLSVALPCLAALSCLFIPALAPADILVHDPNASAMVDMQFNGGRLYYTPNSNATGHDISLADSHSHSLAGSEPWVTNPGASMSGAVSVDGAVQASQAMTTITGEVQASSGNTASSGSNPERARMTSSAAHSVSFLLTEPCLYTISAFASASPAETYNSGYVSLGSSTGTIFYMGRGAPSGVGTPPTPPVPKSGLLPPGNYGFTAHATSVGYGGHPAGYFSSGSCSYSLTLKPRPTPELQTLPPRNVTGSSATLAGKVKANGHNLSLRFEFGPASEPGYTQSIGTGSSGGGDVTAAVADLIPGLPYKYRLVGQHEGGTLAGGEMSFVALPGATGNATCSDDHGVGCGRNPGMAGYSFHTLLASLRITDTPLDYAPPYGPAIPFTLTYTQRGEGQPAAAGFTNLGPKWQLNWLSYLMDDPAEPAALHGQRPGSGGRRAGRFLGTAAGQHHYELQGREDLLVQRSSAGPLPFEVLAADGSKEVYGHPVPVAAGQRLVFLTQRVDASGHAATLTYDAALPRLLKVSDALGRETVLAYELAADPYKVTKVTDPFGRSATFAYDALGRLVKITDVAGIESGFTYEGSGDFISSMTTPYGTTTFTNHESADGTLRRITATDPAGDSEVVESHSGVTAAIPASEPAALVPQGMTVANAQLDRYNSFHWDKKQWKEAPGDHAKAHVYHWLLNPDLTTASGVLASERPPLQGRIWYQYPDQPAPGVVGAITVPSRIGQVIEGGTRLEQRTISSRGRVLSNIDPLGRTTHYQYDRDDTDLVAITRMAGGGPRTLQSFIYDERHLPQASTDAAGQTTTYTWNEQGQISSATTPKAEVTSFSYHAADEPGKARRGALAGVDGALPGGADRVSFDYDAYGNSAAITGPDGYHLAFIHDALDRPLRTTYPDGSYEELSYQALDAKTYRDRRGRITTYTHNSIRQLVAVTDPANRTIRYRWCKCGAMAQLIDAMGRITRWKHDVAGRLASKEYADGSQVSYAYQPLSGRLQSITDEKGQVKTRSYHLDGALAGIAYTNEEHETPDVSFTYDPEFPRLKSMTDGTGTTVYDYYPLSALGTRGAGQLASVDGPLADDTLTYTYDDLGRRLSYAINGVGETRSFDAIGRVAYVVNPLGYFGYSYVGPTGRPTSVTYPNGMVCEFAYHPLAGDFRLKDMIHKKADGSLLSRHGYDYDTTGNITLWTQVSPAAGLNRLWLCGYDAADQLTSITSQDPDTLVDLPAGRFQYSYDAARNRLSETVDGVTGNSVYNSLNQLTGISGDGAPALPQQTYEWDAEDRLVAINYAGTAERTEFSYDGLGRRVKFVEKTAGTVTSTSRYVWDGVEICERRGATGGNVEQRYFGQGFQGVSGGVTGAHFYAMDHLGSILEVVDSSGTVQERISYDAWGKPSFSNATPISTFAFTGHFQHGRSGLTLAPYRAYSSVQGRWISRDPIEEEGGVNLFSYVSNKVTTSIDLLGLEDINLFDSGFLGLWAEPLYEDVKSAPDDEGTCTIGAHSVLQGAGIEDKNSGRRFSAQRVATMVKLKSSCKNAKKIQLYSCYTGRGENSFAQKLANETGLPVTAPNDLVWINGRGGVFVGPPGIDGRRNRSKPGKMITFYPQIQRPK
jgi:RHS repeat-associated protein